MITDNNFRLVCSDQRKVGLKQFVKPWEAKEEKAEGVRVAWGIPSKFLAVIISYLGLSETLSKIEALQAFQISHQTFAIRTNLFDLVWRNFRKSPTKPNII